MLGWAESGILWLKWRRLLGRTVREIKSILLGERGQKISHAHASLIWLFRSEEPSIFIYHNRIAYLNIPHSLISVLNLILISKAYLKLPTSAQTKASLPNVYVLFQANYLSSGFQETRVLLAKFGRIISSKITRTTCFQKRQQSRITIQKFNDFWMSVETLT